MATRSMTKASSRGASQSPDGVGLVSRAKGALVVLVGPDGVGKSTLARAIAEASSVDVRYVHFAPPARGPLPPVPTTTSSMPPPKASGSRSTVLSCLRLLRSWLRFWLGYVGSVRPALAAGSLVLGDRWGYGYLGQPWALRYSGPRWLADFAVRTLPQPNVVVSLTAPVEVVRARKQELTEEQIQAELVGYATLPVRRLITLSAEERPDVLARQVLAAVDTART